MDNNVQESLVQKTTDPLIRFLNKIVILSVKVLAILMVFVIWLSLVDVIIHLVRHATEFLPTFFTVETLINTLGDFLAVLVAIEIFLNISFYLHKEAIHVPLVLATALTAVARKIIILDYKQVDPFHIIAVAAVIISVGVVYWLIEKK